MTKKVLRIGIGIGNRKFQYITVLNKIMDFNS